jgi:hypothetical protein
MPRRTAGDLRMVTLRMGERDRESVPGECIAVR